MANEITVDLTQNEPNALTAIADVERSKLIPKNDYNQVGNPYSSVNRDAVADGDSMGRGTGRFLDIYTEAGTKEDIIDRKDNIKINKFNSKNPYQLPQ